MRKASMIAILTYMGITMLTLLLGAFCLAGCSADMADQQENVVREYIINKRSQFTKKYATLTKTDCRKTNSRKLATDAADVAFGMIGLGFKIYDADEKKVNVNDDSLAEGYIFKIDDAFKLQKGDILARDGHVHIYLGDGTIAEAPNFGWGRVYRSFPQTYEIRTGQYDGKPGILLENGSGQTEYYNRVYRYLGAKGGYE